MKSCHYPRKKKSDFLFSHNWYMKMNWKVHVVMSYLLFLIFFFFFFFFFDQWDLSTATVMKEMYKLQGELCMSAYEFSSRPLYIWRFKKKNELINKQKEKKMFIKIFQSWLYHYFVIFFNLILFFFNEILILYY